MFDFNVEIRASLRDLIDEFRFDKDRENSALVARAAAVTRRDWPRVTRLESYLKFIGWQGSLTLASPGSTPDKRIEEILKAPLDLAPNVPPEPDPEPVSDAIDKAVVKTIRMSPKKRPPRAPRKLLVAQGGRKKRAPDLDVERVPKGLGLITSANLSVRRHLTALDQSPRPNEVQVEQGAAIGDVISLPKREPISMVCRVVPDHKNGRWFKTRAEPVVLWDRAENTYRVNESPRRGRRVDVSAILNLAGAWGARVV